MPRLVLAFSIVALASCSGLGATPSQIMRNEAESTEATCEDMRFEYRLFGAFAVGSAALTGSSALAAAAPQETESRFVFAITSASIAALGIVAVYLRDDLVAEYRERCRSSQDVEELAFPPATDEIPPP